MIHPVFVYHPEHDDPLQLPHDGRGDFLFLGLVGLFGSGDECLVEILLSFGGDLLVGELHSALGKVDALHAAEHFVIPGGVQMLAFAKGQRHMVADGGVHHVQHGFLDVHAVQHLTALGIDDLPLLVHHVVVFQNGLTGLEVAAFHGGLGIFDGTGQHLVLNGGVLIQIELLHHVLDAVAAEQAHQIVLQRDVEPGLAGVTLTAGTAAELIVDPAGFVALGADDE